MQVRSDKSGTTETFTRALEKFSASDHPGTWMASSLPVWPVATQDSEAVCIIANCTGILCGAGKYYDPVNEVVFYSIWECCAVHAAPEQ